MKLFIVPTVRHTGSHFVIDHLLSKYRRFQTVEEALESDYEQIKVFFHLNEPWYTQNREYFDKYPLIVPLRSPESICNSWWRRYGNQENAILKQQLRRLVDDLDTFEPFYLPVDSPHRDIYLDVLNHENGTSFETEWPMIGHIQNAVLEGIDQKLVDFVWENYESFFKRFGYAPRI